MTVLIITYSGDNEASARVAAAVEARGRRAYRFDTERFPTDVEVVLDHDGGGSISGPAGDLDLSTVRSIWYRRASIATGIPDDLDAQLRRPSIEESRRVVHGLMFALGVFTVDPLDVVQRAGAKPLQLRLARQVGLDVPRTLMTNDPEAVRAFAKRCPAGTITKMMSSFAVYEEGREHVVFTNPVSEADLADLDGLALCPMTFQERVEKALELRVTVVGDRVFSSSIDSQAFPRGKDDWRRDGVAMVPEWKHHDLPRPVAQSLLALMRRLGLQYGAADFIVTPDGRHVFLEVNPSGEFMWLLRHPGHPIDQALADLLCRA